MKKLLIILMVVAMASFLFVGCFGTTPPIEPDEPDEPVEPVLTPSVTPVIEKIANVGDSEADDGIINLYSSATQYMNADEVADGILVLGFAPKYSEVNVYVGGIVVGTGTAYGGDEEFIVFVAEDNLGADGAKTLYAIATELGFAESAPSTVYAFTLDVVAPELEEVTADLGDVTDGTVTVTFSEEIDEDTVDADGVNWLVQDLTNTLVSGEPISAELISSKVIELEVDYSVVAGDSAPGDVIRVTYEIIPEDVDAEIEEVSIKDLAGNPVVESVEYCWLELEED